MLDKTFGVFGGNLADFNAQLHESTAYNAFQIGVTALAAFTGGMTSTMSCFVAGTLVLTACGLVAIENIKVGDKVFSQNTETGEQAVKTVVETYERQVTELVHLRIDGEDITTTHDHPFYVVNYGFKDAGKLSRQDKLFGNDGRVCPIDDISFLSEETPRTVYNFQVEDHHTYFVGYAGILVHNAGDAYSRPSHYRKGVREKVFEDAKGDDGIVRNPETGQPIDPNKPWDMGHKPGYEFRKHQESARTRGITRQQFLDEYISFESTEEPTTVYNFKVEDNHTYYVSKLNVFVHNADCVVHPDGEIEITDWDEYPENGPRPDGKLKLIDGDEYSEARDMANKANRRYHRQNPSCKGQDIHEVHPVKFGGSPTNTSNKIPLPRSEHSKYTNFWNKIQSIAETQPPYGN